MSNEENANKENMNIKSSNEENVNEESANKKSTAKERNMAQLSFEKVSSTVKHRGEPKGEQGPPTPSASEGTATAPRKNESGSKLKTLINEKKSTTQVGFHIENDLHEVLKKLQEQNGRGTNSKIVNELLRELFEEEGLL